MQYEWTVTGREANVSLLAFVQERLKDKAYSMRKIKGWIDAGYCFVAGRQQKFSRTSVLPGQKVVLRIIERKPQEIATIYKDDAIMVIDKPAGITCDERLEKKLGYMLVHRLDKETTGLLLLAKTKDIKNYFIEEFRNLAVEKCYVAIVDGVVEKQSGTIENYVGPIERYQGHVKWGVVSKDARKNNLTVWGAPKSPGLNDRKSPNISEYGVTYDRSTAGAFAQPKRSSYSCAHPKDGHLATTIWKVMKRSKSATLLSLMPKTGKTHQLRIHTSFMGHPILGDHTYAKKFTSSYKAPRVLLHAEKLRFTHPVTKEVLSLAAKLPPDFEACLKELF